MTFVISAGALLPATSPSSPSSPSRGYASTRLASTGIPYLDRTIAYDAIYRSQPNVRSVVDFLAKNIATLGAGLFRGEGAERESLQSTPLGLMLRKPQPNRSRFAFYRALVADVAIFDAYLAVKLSLGGRPALLRVPPPFVQLMGGDWRAPDWFKVTDGYGRTLAQLAPDRVLYVTGYAPDSEARGVAPMETLRSTIAEEIAAQGYRRGLWRNGARVGAVITRPREAPQWKDGARERFLEDWRASWTGDSEEAGGTPILEEGMELHKVAMTSVEAEYLGARRLSREETFSTYHVDPRLVGISSTSGDDAATRRGLYADTFGPWCSQVGSELTAQLIPDFDGFGLDVDTDYVELNLEGKLRGHFLDQAEVLSRSVGGPWLTRDEARAMFNRAPLADGIGAEVITPLNVMIGGRSSPADTAPGSPGAGQVAPPKVRELDTKAAGSPGGELIPRWKGWNTQFSGLIGADIATTRASTVSRLGAGKTLAEAFNRSALVTNLTATAKAMAATISDEEARHTMDELGVDADVYDPTFLLPALLPGSERFAEAIADALFGRLQSAVDTAKTPATAIIEAVQLAFDGFTQGAMLTSVATRVTTLGNSTRADVAEKAGRPRKTWRVHSSNPRSSHSALNGQSVEVGTKFANGARWPGDANLPPAETANCTCTLDFG